MRLRSGAKTTAVFVVVAGVAIGTLLSYDLEDYASFADETFDDDLFDCMSFAWLPLPQLFSRQFAVWSLMQSMTVLCKPCGKFFSDVSQRARSWTVVFILETQ